jgi:hypothetical protein
MKELLAPRIIGKKKETAVFPSYELEPCRFIPLFIVYLAVFSIQIQADE